MYHVTTIYPLLAQLSSMFPLWSLLKIAVVIVVVLTMVAYSVLAERKISAFIQHVGRIARRYHG